MSHPNKVPDFTNGHFRQGTTATILKTVMLDFAFKVERNSLQKTAGNALRFEVDQYDDQEKMEEHN